MAIFNPTPNPTNDPDYLRSSKEPDKIKANTAFGDLFGNAGQLLDQAVGAADRGITEIFKGQAREQLTALIEDPSNRQISSADVNAAALSADEMVPEGVTSRIDGLKRLQAAASARPDLKAKFDLEVAKVSKEIRSQWPGHTDQIDAYIKGYLGTNAANQARESLIAAQVAAARSSSAAANKMETRWRTNMDWFGAAGISKEDFMKDPDRAENAIAKAKGDALVLEQETKGFIINGLGTQAGTRNTKLEAERLATNYMNMYVQNVAGTMLRDLQKKAADIRTNTRASGAEIQQADAQLQVALQNVRRELYNIWDRPVDPTGKRPGSFRTALLDNNKIDNLVDSIMKPLEMTRELYSVDKGAAGTAARQIATNRELSKIKLFEDFPVTERLDTLRHVIPENVLSQIYNTAKVSTPEGDKLLGVALTEQIMLGGFFKVATPTKPNPSVTDMDNALKVDQNGNHDPRREVPAKQRQALVDGLNIMIDNTQNPTMAARAVQALYDPKYFTRVTDREQYKQMWTFLSHPARSERVAALDRTYPGLASQYQSFNEMLFRNAFKYHVDTAIPLSTAGSGIYDWKWDPQQALIRLDPRPGRGDTLDQFLSPGKMAKERDTAAEINSYLRVMGPMYTAFGQDPNTALPDLLKKMKLEFGAERTPNVLDKLLDMMSPKKAEPSATGKPAQPATEDATIPDKAAPMSGYLPEELQYLQQLPESQPGHWVLNRKTGQYEPYYETSGRVQGKSQDRVKRDDPFGRSAER